MEDVVSPHHFHVFLQFCNDFMFVSDPGIWEISVNTFSE